MDKSKVCISKKVSFIVMGGVVAIGVILVSAFLMKTKTSSNTRASGIQCIYETQQDCKDSGCGGLCTTGGCIGGKYQCKAVVTRARDSKGYPLNGENMTTSAPEICVPYGTKFYTTSDGQCWSLKSKKLFGGNFPVQVCGQEQAKVEDTLPTGPCPKKSYCMNSENKNLSVLNGNQLLREMYKRGVNAGCVAVGVETDLSSDNLLRMDINAATKDIKSPFCSTNKQVADQQCDINKYECKGRYEIINGNCWNLTYKKCPDASIGYVDSQNKPIYDEPGCCSDVVDMSFCK